MDAKKYDSGALPRNIHAQFRFEDLYLPRVLSLIPQSGIVMDIGTGVGRDASEMHDRGDGRLLVVGIDPDEKNYIAALTTYPHKEIALCRDWDEVAGVNPAHQIAYLVKEVQSANPPQSLRADFINCSAVMMFVPPQDHGATLDSLHGMVKPEGSVFLRFRTEGLRDGMNLIDPKILHTQCTEAGFNVDIMPHFPDPPPTSRDFSWHDWILSPRLPGPA